MEKGYLPSWLEPDVLDRDPRPNPDPVPLANLFHVFAKFENLTVRVDGGIVPQAANDVAGKPFKIWSSSADQERTAKRYVGTMFIELNNVPTIIGLRLNNNKGLPPFAY